MGKQKNKHSAHHFLNFLVLKTKPYSNIQIRRLQELESLSQNSQPVHMPMAEKSAQQIPVASWSVCLKPQVTLAVQQENRKFRIF